MSRMSEDVFVMAALLIVTLALLAAVGWFKQAQCEARWADSGMTVRWGLLTGCQVQRADGTWLPADAVRDTTR